MSEITDAKAAFVKAVLSGNTGVTEYSAWRDEFQAEQRSIGEYNAAEYERSTKEWDTYSRLRSEACRELSVFPHLSRQNTQPGQEEAWSERASNYAGREIKRFEEYAALPQPKPVVFKNPPQGDEPRDYVTELAAVASGKTS